MAERRSLTDGLKATPTIDPAVAREFIYGGKGANPAEAKIADGVQETHALRNHREQRDHRDHRDHGEPGNSHESQQTPSTVTSRSPISTRIRSDFALALKRASLERQLKGVEPHTLQDILEQAIEPWLKSNGYLS